MICWVIHHGVPFDVAHALDEAQLLAYTLMFSKFENGNLTWDWEGMTFIDGR
jgi:hypothetical protein